MNHPIPIADLHCDLLEHLTRGPDRSPLDRAARCSIPQLREGHVSFQVLAIFALAGKGSAEKGRRQAGAFRRLVDDHRESLLQAREAHDLTSHTHQRTAVMAAIEGGSAFCEEDEPLDAAFDRLLEIEREVGRLLYLSLTWHNENRFGGGNASEAGLKRDGEHLLELLADRGIAVDLSHASPRLAREILEFVDARSLRLPILASHSDFAAVVDTPRNLPDDVAREIIARGGVIGLNFIRRFLGPTAEAGLAANIEHALSLGGEKALGLGADFFHEGLLEEGDRAYFFPELGEPASYPFVLRLVRERGLGADGFVTDLAHGNVVRFVASTLERREPPQRERR